MNLLLVFLNQYRKDQTLPNFIIGLGMFLFWGSILTFIIGLILLFFKNKREIAIKILIYSTVAFVVGFGVCAVGFIV